MFFFFLREDALAFTVTVNGQMCFVSEHYLCFQGYDRGAQPSEKQGMEVLVRSLIFLIPVSPELEHGSGSRAVKNGRLQP